MAGRINDDDVAKVRERARIEDIVATQVSLKRAGGGGLVGLCPFHDERTPSFHVSPSKGFFHCFGCGEGGDAITFVQKIHNYSFTEAVEHLADKVGVQLRYEEGTGGPRQAPGLRSRILAANAAASEYFSQSLLTADALPGRQMLDQRGFDRQAAETFGVGWSPRGGRDLGHHLRRQGFTDEELVQAGLIRAAGWDFFQGRVMWPIRDAGGAVLGFGARRILEDDRMPAKYINTPETPVYKKSHVLYGLDLARRAIGKQQQAVVVEGYTDVMACHLSGVDTAVASCGTAFGSDHARLLQRLLGSDDAGQGEIIFTFDGDEAGQAAALKVFKLDASFSTQTYVAVDPEGADPCDIRMARGDEAVRDLVGRRIPLYRFVMRHTLDGFDLDRADARVSALRAAAPLVAGIRDKAVATSYARELAGMLGMPLEEVRSEVSRGRRDNPAPVVEPEAPVHGSGADVGPDPKDPRLLIERDCAKLLVQCPALFTPEWNGLSEDHFTHPAYRAVIRTARAAQAARNSDEWPQALRDAMASDLGQQLMVELAVEPLLREPTPRYVDEYAARLQVGAMRRTIADVKSRLQRTNPLDNRAEYDRQFQALLEMERTKKDLEARVWGAEGA